MIEDSMTEINYEVLILKGRKTADSELGKPAPKKRRKHHPAVEISKET